MEFCFVCSGVVGGVVILLQDKFFAFEKITYKTYKSVYGSAQRLSWWLIW